MIRTGRLVLSNRRLYKHYQGVILLGTTSLFLIYLVSTNTLTPFSEGASFYWLFLAFPVMAVVLFLVQYTALRLKEVPTGLSREENDHIARETLKTLDWTIDITNKDFLEAHTPPRFLAYTGRGSGEIISLVITDGKLLVNSIGNPDHQIPWSGLLPIKNRQNVRKFVQTFELLTASRLAAGTAYMYG